MKTSKVIFSRDLRTNATHLSSKTTIVTDAPIDNHGKGQSFSPTDLTSTSLASCMLTVLGIYCDQNNIDMDGSNAEVLKKMSSEGMRRIIGIDVDLQILTSEELDEKQKNALERVARTCPVALSLHPELYQNIKISFSVRQA